jgi:hypothetical protein
VLLVFCVVTSLVGYWLAARGMAVRVFGWSSLSVVTLGAVGVYLGPRTGFPHPLDARVTARQRFLVPALVGVAFGVGDVALFKLVIHPAPLTGLMPFMQPFPYSVLLYAAGALETEALHRLIPMPLLLWLAGKVIPGKGASPALFLVLAVLTSAVEPYLQLPEGPGGLLAFSFGNGFVFNLLQALFFRWYGLLAALTVRLGHYLVWHVLFGLVTEYC